MIGRLMTTHHQLTDLARELESLAASLADSLAPLSSWGGGAALVELLLDLDASPTYPWRLDEDWRRRLAARASAMAGDMRRLGRPRVLCVADDLVLSVALERVLDPADLAAIAALSSPATESITSPGVSDWGPEHWFEPIGVETTALAPGEVTSLTRPDATGNAARQ